MSGLRNAQRFRTPDTVAKGDTATADEAPEPAEKNSVPEQALAGKHHGDPMLVGGGNYLGVAD